MDPSGSRTSSCLSIRLVWDIFKPLPTVRIILDAIPLQTANVRRANAEVERKPHPDESASISVLMAVAKPRHLIHHDVDLISGQLFDLLVLLREVNVRDEIAIRARQSALDVFKAN